MWGFYIEGLVKNKCKLYYFFDYLIDKRAGVTYTCVTKAL